jgi:hypothetical protein
MLYLRRRRCEDFLDVIQHIFDMNIEHLLSEPARVEVHGHGLKWAPSGREGIGRIESLVSLPQGLDNG